jgi:hypothetical protein
VRNFPARKTQPAARSPLADTSLCWWNKRI